MRRLLIRCLVLVSCMTFGVPHNLWAGGWDHTDSGVVIQDNLGDWNRNLNMIPSYQPNVTQDLNGLNGINQGQDLDVLPNDNSTLANQVLVPVTPKPRAPRGN